MKEEQRKALNNIMRKVSVNYHGGYKYEMGFTDAVVLLEPIIDALERMIEPHKFIRHDQVITEGVYPFVLGMVSDSAKEAMKKVFGDKN